MCIPADPVFAAVIVGEFYVLASPTMYRTTFGYAATVLKAAVRLPEEAGVSVDAIWLAEEWLEWLLGMQEVGWLMAEF